jgi:hypothetical protein
MAIPHLLLIKEIHRQAEAQRIPPPAVTRLVKLLYLADLEWRREHGGEPLTDLSWRFLHFGPYANELLDVFGGENIQSVDFKVGKTAKRMIFDREDSQASLVPREVSTLIADLVKKWGETDLNSLLDYVYFETEPMETAERGTRLDFSRLRESRKRAKLVLDRAALGTLRTRLRDRVRALNLHRQGLVTAYEASKGEELWDEDDGPVQVHTGARIKLPGA